MSRRAWRIGGAVIAILLLLAASFVSVVSWRSADQLVHPERDPLARTPSDVGLGYERITFRADHDLVGWWIPAEDAEGVVIFLHGYGDSKEQALALAPALHAASYHVLAFDLRAHGESGGDVTTVGLDEVRDVQAAVAYAAARDAPASERLALIGWSMGGATAINAAAELPEVDAVVSDSAFATLTNIASNSITKFTDLPKYPFGPLSVVFAGWMVGKDVGDNAPVRALARSDAPTLVIQGLADDIALPADDGEALARAAPPGSELWLVEGASHVQAHAVASAEYEARVVSFLREALA